MVSNHLSLMMIKEEEAERERAVHQRRFETCMVRDDLDASIPTET